MDNGALFFSTSRVIERPTPRQEVQELPLALAKGLDVHGFRRNRVRVRHQDRDLRESLTEGNPLLSGLVDRVTIHLQDGRRSGPLDGSFEAFRKVASRPVGIEIWRREDGSHLLRRDPGTTWLPGLAIGQMCSAEQDLAHRGDSFEGLALRFRWPVNLVPDAKG